MSRHVRHGRAAVRPYLYGAYDLPEFVSEVFGAETLERHDMGPESAHVELLVGDGVVVVEAGRLPEGFEPTRASVYVYVEDVDTVYARAMARGATSRGEPEDKPYGDRGAGFDDPSGNTWWVATHLGHGTG